MKNKAFITGSAGFIGFHLCKLLLREGWLVHGYDGFTDYYDVGLKQERTRQLHEYKNFTSCKGMLEDIVLLRSECQNFEPDVFIHLAAQAGVRYSIENPRAYIDSNIIGTFNVLEVAKDLNLKHLLMASTSSVYGANEEMPFTEIQKTETQITLYAATKKANENMAHAYAHLWKIPTTMFRFFTVYGPWGRPDMALFKFVDAILSGRPIEIYNNGQMYRDFTYVDDLVKGIYLLINSAPDISKTENRPIEGDNLSPVAPFRVVNIGNAQKIELIRFIEAIEDILNIKAQKILLPMQIGDVPATWANTDLLSKLTGYHPDTSYKEGIENFVSWFRDYYNK